MLSIYLSSLVYYLLFHLLCCKKFSVEAQRNSARELYFRDEAEVLGVKKDEETLEREAVADKRPEVSTVLLLPPPLSN